jgi:hypothetical protein
LASSTNKIAKVTKKHISNYPNPMRLIQGQTVLIGEKYSGPEEWDNWIYCRTLDSTLEGWVPEQILDISHEKAYVLEKYIAKELNVDPGETVEIKYALNGWVWVRTLVTSEEGWVPKANLQSYS